ncbi:MAG: valine--tRNA ligase [Sphingobium sp.]|nr:valine--tRNA ligase [Sphingobium sp.]MBP6111134.1 valine--tRNA ligase [Sphingobium sp.]MBP8672030.1 valine--tRNA ligase [Sphingobium sp.]MBP9157997.1 valine--tRNA ligase [Sphingobium sp.]MCC6482788.1 valine--tRNA ligase [Sphingomonadaceae bacterium]
MTELAKTFDPASIEARWYQHWEANGLFRPERPEALPFTIVNPPPNVTGSLHIGHALDNTLQDIMIRYERLRGKDALWVVGTDHAGIATQMVVERQLNAQGQKRTDFSREAFIDKVWEWKAESGGTITGQLRRLGCSMDWSREQFTMDPHFTRAVTKVFVDLFNEGLIYRDKRLVNWDPGLKTAISDLEVETREVQGKFWHFRYPLADGVTLSDGRDHIVVATTRPETMLADMAVAVNGADPRYSSVIGMFIELPITGRRIPIVADDHADPELGSGAVKITPGHDFNDFEVGKRAGIAAGNMLNMLDADAKVQQTADGLIPADYIGLDRFQARNALVAALEAAGMLELIEDRVIQTPYGDRSGVVIEPWLTDQWYLDAATLAKPAIEAVKSGAIEIVPKSWEKTYFNWMENIQPWCVSRQLWWGHRIPAWYGPTAKQVNEQAKDTDRVVFVGVDEIEASQAAASYYRSNGCQFDQISFFDPTSADATPFLNPDSIRLYRDPDVLDTWFSSALWPFATLGWPDENAPLVSRHYPNDLLISGFDILFFWNARMAMQGIHFMNDVPWKRLYLHGLVRAADGQKMSKSKGNVVDPLGLIDQYGADALRFFMAAMESQGRDVKMDEKRVEGYRNFATKLWNATRFAMSNGIGASQSITAPMATLAVNKWIIGEVVETVAALDKALADLRFDAAANAIYHFVWDQFCDWYLELIKGALDEETKQVAGWVLDQILVMLHPFMPFITEELWHALGERQYDLIVAKWPEPSASVDAEAKAEVEWLIKLVSEVRATRTELGVPPSVKVPLIVEIENRMLDDRHRKNEPIIQRLARVSVIEVIGHSGIRQTVGISDSDDAEMRLVASRGAAQLTVDGLTYVIPLEGVVDIAAEKARLAKALEAVTKEAKSLEARLANPAFVEKAKAEAVEKARADHAEKSAEAERLAVALARLG